MGGPLCVNMAVYLHRSYFRVGMGMPFCLTTIVTLDPGNRTMRGKASTVMVTFSPGMTVHQPIREYDWSDSGVSQSSLITDV